MDHRRGLYIKQRYAPATSDSRSSGSMASTTIPTVRCHSLLALALCFTQLSRSMRKSSLLGVARQEATPRLCWQGKDCKSYCSKQRSSQGQLQDAPSRLYPLHILTRYRYHIGESLIPSVRHYLQFIGAEQKLVEYGFKHKVWWSVVGASVASERVILLTPP